MFRAIFTRCSNLNLITRSYARRGRANPGIDRRLNAFADQAIKEEPDFIENSESDFMNVHELHKQFEQEEQKYTNNIQLWITRNKYFKTKNLNFLTWSEKEQIRHLHASDPEEWSIEKLSECFPADPLTIQKIIKAKWFPKDNKRIEKHDKSVKKSWQLFRSNELTELDPEIENHLRKFADREFHETASPKIQRPPLYEIQKPAISEFSSIITSCKKYQEPSKPQQIESRPEEEFKIPEIKKSDPERDSFILKSNSESQESTKPLTFREFQRVSSSVESNSTNNQLEAGSRDDLVVDFKKLHKTNSNNELVNIQPDNSVALRSLEIKERIKIPKSIWKKGKIFKVDDCFYDDDGEFLYRVPGLK